MFFACLFLYSRAFALNVSNAKAGKSIFPAAVFFWSRLAGLFPLIQQIKQRYQLIIE